MIAFPNMLIPAAKEAGMKYPEDADNFESSEYPHFAVFCNIQLGSRMPYMGCHWDNAKIIAAIPEDKIFQVSLAELIDAGIHIST